MDKDKDGALTRRAGANDIAAFVEAAKRFRPRPHLAADG